MNLSAALESIEIGWRETVRPYIERKQFDSALVDMRNLNLTLNGYIKQFAAYHTGLKFVVSARSVQDELAKREVKLETIDEFEAYLKQTKLAVSTGNRF